jgi:hypothetical protein
MDSSKEKHRFFFLISKTLNNNNKPIDQQSDCWSTEAFASDSETHSEDGSNILRLASNHNTNSTLSINDPQVNSFSIDSNSGSSLEELAKQQKYLTISTTTSSK